MKFITISPMRMSLFVLNCLFWESRSYSTRGIMTSRAMLLSKPKFCPAITSLARSLSNSLTGDADCLVHPAKEWNLKFIKKDIAKRQDRVFKKVQNANARLDQVKFKAIGAADEVISEEASVNIKAIEDGLLQLQSQLHFLSNISEELQNIKSTNDNKFVELIPSLEELDIKDPPPPKSAPKEKGPPPKPSGSRLPYYRYESVDGIEIRVGRGADDNDELSCNRAHRDDNEWWMHVAGHPGSHVVIRSSADDLRQAYKQTVIDAALLTAMHSKASQSGKVQVTLTRCRNVSKPRGAKAGLVQLMGDMYKVDVNVRGESKRLEYLKRL